MCPVASFTRGRFPSLITDSMKSLLHPDEKPYLRVSNRHDIVFDAPPLRVEKRGDKIKHQHHSKVSLLALLNEFSHFNTDDQVNKTHPEMIDFREDSNIFRLLASELKAQGSVSTNKSEMIEKPDNHLKTLKVGGSAFRLTKDRAYGHGTVLLNSPNLDLIPVILNQKFNSVVTFTSSSAVPSVPSPVTNLLADIDPEVAYKRSVETIIQFYKELYGVEEVIHLGDQEIVSLDPEIHRIRNELLSWEWRIGRTPPFKTHDGLKVVNGKIDSIDPLMSKSNFPVFIGQNFCSSLGLNLMKANKFNQTSYSLE